VNATSPNPEPIKVVPELLPALDEKTPRQRMKDARLAAKAARWNVPDEVRALSIQELTGNLKDPTASKELRRQTIDTLNKLVLSDLRADELADKQRRLDAGQSTENVAVIRIIDADPEPPPSA
jgi:hypothetical protein